MDNKYLSLKREWILRLHDEVRVLKQYTTEHLAAVVTILYLVGSLAGVVYLNSLMKQFGVNVFNHIEPSDYLLAILSSTGVIIAFLGFSFITTSLIYLVSKKVPDVKKDVWYNRIYYRLLSPLYKPSPLKVFFVLYCGTLIYYADLVAKLDAGKVLENKGEHYNITLNYPISIANSDVMQLENTVVITSTNANLFLHIKKLNQVVIIPHSNIAALVPLIHREDKAQHRLTEQTSAR